MPRGGAAQLIKQLPTFHALGGPQHTAQPVAVIKGHTEIECSGRRKRKGSGMRFLRKHLRKSP